MCGPPDHFFPSGQIEYEINAHMKKGTPIDLSEARKQWITLKDALLDAGACLSIMKQAAGLPDMVFSANFGLVKNHRAFISRFRHKERSGEALYFRDWCIETNYVYAAAPKGSFFEGEGDALWCGEKLVCGYGFRSDETGVRLAGDFFENETVLLHLIDPYFYHLDTCFSWIKRNLMLVYLSAFDARSQDELERLGELIPVSSYDAHNFVCNTIPIGKTLITSHMSAHLKTLLENKYGFKVVTLDFSIFKKAGGAAKCLIVFI